MLPSDTQFGPELARAVAHRLRSSTWLENLGAIVRSHRDYTGHGLFHDHGTGVFFLARSSDGMPREPLIAFSSEGDFIGWLAAQSDFSLSGLVPQGPPDFMLDPENQRITRLFLTDSLSPE